MSSAKIITGVALVFGAVGMGTAVVQHNDARQIGGVLQKIQRDHAALRVQLTAAETRAREAEQRLEAREAQLAADAERDAAPRGKSGVGRNPSASSSTATPALAAGGPVNPGMEMLANPEYVRLSVEKYRAGLSLQFAPLYRMLQLSPEQIAKFEANRTEYQQVTQDVWSAAVAKGVSVSDPSVTGLARDAMGDLEKELIAVLGDAGYKQYAQFNRSQSGLEVVSALAGNLYRTDAPLNAQQGDQLTGAVMNHTRSVPVAPGSKVMRFETDWAAVAAQARGLLTPQQATVFESVLTTKKLQQQITALSSAARAGGNPKPGS